MTKLVSDTRLGTRLRDLWADQKTYNLSIRYMEHREPDVEFWTTQYLLGLVSEIDEVLREINWKRHRKQDKKEWLIQNIGYELADLTKYIFSLWELWEFSPQQMMEIIEDKTTMLKLQQEQETFKPDIGQTILICDLDGTIADWRKTFVHWMQQAHKLALIKSDATANLFLAERDFGLDYPQYAKLKDEFEGEGSYKRLLPFTDGITTVQQLLSKGIYLIIYTARPRPKHKRIWLDTFRWLTETANIWPDELHFGAEERILEAIKLREAGHPVLMFEDNPDLALRAAYSEIPVYVRIAGYNEHLKGEPGIQLLDKYTDKSVEWYWNMESD